MESIYMRWAFTKAISHRHRLSFINHVLPTHPSCHRVSSSTACDNILLTIMPSGGGITGLAFAIALAKTGANVDVDVYESASSFSEIGAGIGFSTRILEDLHFLGFSADLEAKGLVGKS